MSPIPPSETGPGPGRRFLNAPVWLWLAFAGVGLLFILLPQLDLAVSGLFYTPGVGFAARGTWFERLVHQSTYWFLVLGTPALVGLWLALGYSLLVAWARLAAGGHFLSDILVSWFIVALLAYWLDGLLSSPPPEPGAALLPPG